MGDTAEKRKALYEQFEMALQKATETNHNLVLTRAEHDTACDDLQRIKNQLVEEILTA